MRAEVVCVGTELLLGDIVNGNAASIGRMLASAGIDCFMHVSVGDNEERIAAAIGAALGRADAVIVTGGLGPTQDDVTREAIAALTGRELRRDETFAQHLSDHFARLGREMAQINLRQADVPEGARTIPVTWGTAPGLIVEHGDGVIYALPGVPAEMEDMMTRAVLPDLLARSGQPAKIASRVVRVAGMSESSIAEALHQTWEGMDKGVTIAFLAGHGEVRIRVTAKSDEDSRLADLLDSAEAAVRAVLGAAVVGTDGDTLEQVVGALLLERGWTLACAESLTGGAVSARICSTPGASEYFRGAIVSYATDTKEMLLGVPGPVLEERGPVSVEAATAMAQGARERLGSDVGLSATGVAGPMEQGRPVGTVILGVSGPLGDATREVRLPGDRNTVRSLAAGAALNLLRLYLREALA